MVVVSYNYNELHSMIAFGVGFRLQKKKEMYVGSTNNTLGQNIFFFAIRLIAKIKL